MIKLFRYLQKKDWVYILICIGLIILQVGLELKMPDYTKALTTLVSSEQITMSDVWYNGGRMLLCALGSLVAAIVCGYLISKVASSFTMRLREKLFEKVIHFSNQEINQFSTPSLITRTTTDVVQMQMFVAMGVQLLFKAPIMAIWAICKISATHMAWTLATILTVVVIVMVVGALIAICYQRFKKIQKLTDDLNDITRENVSGVRVVRAFNAEKYQEEKFEKTNQEITKNNLFTSRTMGLMNPVMTICMNGLTLAIYFIGAILINQTEGMIEKQILLGNMTAFTQYAMQVIMAFMMLIMIFIILPRTIVSGGRIYDVLDTPLHIKNGEGATSLETGTIEFQDVSFGYTKDAAPALQHISFQVKKGETLAIVGATGSGKTTLINLIPRFDDVSSGAILVDGVNVKAYKEDVLRDKIALASQKAVLFKGTIKENIAYGKAQIDEEKIDMALEISQSQFIKELAEGIHSEVAQGGTNFSGGQKQRISIARAIYKDAEIIIFDDTFSALDYKTDMLIRKKIKEKLKDKTVIIVAQRIGTIKNADQIVVLDEGKIVGIGKHETLLDSCSVYQEIALSQLTKEEL